MKSATTTENIPIRLTMTAAQHLLCYKRLFYHSEEFPRQSLCSQMGTGACQAARQWRQKKIRAEQLATVRRTGPDYRSGRDVTGQDYLDAFAFRGGEFGNWMTQNDRRASLNMGFEALKDLAAASRSAKRIFPIRARSRLRSALVAAAMPLRITNPFAR